MREWRKNGVKSKSQIAKPSKSGNFSKENDKYEIRYRRSAERRQEHTF